LEGVLEKIRCTISLSPSPSPTSGSKTVRTWGRGE
jgi:hypothetical protein